MLGSPQCGDPRISVSASMSSSKCKGENRKSHKEALGEVSDAGDEGGGLVGKGQRSQEKSDLFAGGRAA